MVVRLKELKLKNVNRYLPDFLKCLIAFGQTILTRHSARLLLKHKRKLGHTTIVALLDDSVIGTATLILEPKFLRSCSIIGHVEDVAVLDEHRKNGVGKLLVDRLCKIAKKHGCYKVILDCADKNVHFYEECGFHRHENCMRKDV